MFSVPMIFADTALPLFLFYCMFFYIGVILYHWAHRAYRSIYLTRWLNTTLLILGINSLQLLGLLDPFTLPDGLTLH